MLRPCHIRNIPTTKSAPVNLSIGRSLKDMAAETTVISMDFARRRKGEAHEASRLFSIKEVGDHCGLPGPVIMQLVPRTWTAQGWMYTGEQLRASIGVAEDLRRRREAVSPIALHDPTDALICDGCGEVVSAAGSSRAGWLNVVEPDGSVGGDPLGRDYCPRCLVSCPVCGGSDTGGPCRVCGGAGLVAKRY
jgi:hypothetical protein